MKKICLLAGLLFSFQIMTTAQKLEKLWETDSIFKIPESVLYDAQANVLYVSNIDGASGAKDGRGHISKLSPDGKVIDLHWLTGLHAPKGMATWQHILGTSKNPNFLTKIHSYYKIK